jgi:hypothetical protein
MDKGGGINLEIPLSDLGISTTSNGVSGFTNNVLVLISELSTYNNKYKLSSGAYDAWLGVDSFKDRVVEYDEKTRLYRVYPKATYPLMWSYFATPPDNRAGHEPKWIANCLGPTSAKEAEDMSNVRCRTRLSFDRTEAEITLSGQYIRIVSEISRQVRKKVAEWAK